MPNTESVDLPDGPEPPRIRLGVFRAALLDIERMVRKHGQALDHVLGSLWWLELANARELLEQLEAGSKRGAPVRWHALNLIPPWESVERERLQRPRSINAIIRDIARVRFSIFVMDKRTPHPRCEWIVVRSAVALKKAYEEAVALLNRISGVLEYFRRENRESVEKNKLHEREVPKRASGRKHNPTAAAAAEAMNARSDWLYRLEVICRDGARPGRRNK
jgi:hypothetical protein